MAVFLFFQLSHCHNPTILLYFPFHPSSDPSAMHLFSPDRPTITLGQPELLLDGSAVPGVYAMPLANGLVCLSVMLRRYSSPTRAYEYHHAEVEPLVLPSFFDAYMEDPEATLLTYFDWEPQDMTKQTRASAVVEAPKGDFASPTDLL